jgi:uncharacterized cupin superfamily protein
MVMADPLPLVIRWDTFPLDISDPLQRFRLSRWNYFHKDQAAGVMVGYWEAEAGQETVGEGVGGGTADEFMVILEGQVRVSDAGEPERIAGPGDVIAAMRFRRARLVVEERVRALFFVYHIDPDAAERVMRGSAASAD